MKNNIEITNKLLTPDQLADFLNISKTTIYRLIDSRKIPFYKIGGSIRFDKKDITSYLQENKINPI